MFPSEERRSRSDVVDRIFLALGGPSAVAAVTGDPVQTVHSWKRKGSIPRWRRPSLIDVARRLNKKLPPEGLTYLASGADPLFAEPRP